MNRTLNGLGNDTTTNVYVNTAFASGEATEVEQQSNLTQAKVNLAFKSNTTQATSVNNNDLILIADNATGKIVKYVEANLVGQTLTATLPLVISNDVISTNFTKSSTDTLTNKTITSFTGGNSASITTPSSNGTLALTSDIPNLTATSPITYETSTGTIATTFTPTSTTSMSGKTFTDSVNFTNGEIILKSTTATSTSNARINFKDSNNANIGSVGNFLGDFFVSSIISGKDLRLSANAGKIKFDNTDTEFKASGTNNFNSGVITNLSTLNTHTIPSGTGTFALTSQIIDPINSINFGTNTSTTGTRTLGLSTENTNINGDTITIQGQTATNLRSTNAVNINGNALVIKAETSAGVIFDPATSGTYHGIDVKDNALKNSLLNGKIKFNSDLDVISKNIHIRTDVDTANLKNARIFFNSTNGSLEYAKMGLFNDNFQILQTIPEKDLVLSNQSGSNTLPSGSIRIDGDMKCEKILFFRDQQNAVDKSKIFMDGDNLKIQTINSGNTDIHIIPTGSGKVFISGNTQFNFQSNIDCNSGSITNLEALEGGLNLKNGTTSAGFIDFFETTSTGTNKITLKPHNNSIAGDYTITLPNSGGQMILNDTTDTFSNKSFSDVINFVISTTNTASVGLNGSNLRLQALTGNSDVQLVASGNGKISFTGDTQFFSASTINANSSNITNIASLNTHPLPQGSSTLVDVNSTQVLTNKSIDYSQITSKPTIPTNTNQLVNGAGYITANTTDTLTNKTINSFIGNLSTAVITTPATTGTLALFSQIPTNNNQLTNGANYITASSTDTLTNKTITSFTGGSSAVITTPSTTGTLALEGNAFAVSGSNPDKEATAPVANDYIFSSGAGSNGNCRVIIKSDTDNASSETANCQILFSKENDLVQGSIGLGTPSSATDDNDLILNSAYTGKGIIFKTQGTQRFKISPTIIEPSEPFKGLQVQNSTTSGGQIEFLEGTDNGTNKITLKAPDTISADATLTLPTTTGTLALTSDIPTNNNQLTNGASYITANTSDTLTNKTINSFIGSVSTAVITTPATTGTLALFSQIPTNNNQLTNGANYITASSTDTLTNKNFGDNVDITGQLKITRVSNALILKGVGTGNANVVGMDIQDATNTRKGFIGNFDSSTSDMWLYADAGNIRLRATDKVRVLSNKLAIGAQGSLTDPKQVILQSPSSLTADYTIDLPSSAGTLALTSEIPTNNNQLTNGALYITADSVNNLENKDFIDTPEFKNAEIKIKATTNNANFLNSRVMFHQLDDTQIGDIGHSNGHLEVKNLVSNKDIEIDTTGTGKIRLEALTQCEKALKVSNGISSAGYIELFENSTNGSSAIKLSAPEAIATPLTETKQTLQDFNGTIALIEKNGFNPITSPFTGLEAPTSSFFNFTSGAGANGDCVFRIEANTDNAVSNSTPQLIFRKRGVDRGSIGIGTPNTSFLDDLQITAPDTNGKVVISQSSSNIMAYFSPSEVYINKTLKAKECIETSNASTSAGYVDFFENTSNGTNKVRVIGPSSITGISKVLTLPDNTGTIALAENTFAVSGSNPSKIATAPSCNDYVLSSGAGGNGSCRLIIKSDTDNQSNESNNCQILFSKEADIVQGSIGMGTPASTTDDNLMIYDNVYGTNMLFKLSGTQVGYVNSSGFQNGSDRELKKDIEKLDSSYCLQKALDLQPVSWYWKNDMPDTHQEIGFIAQDVSNVVPQVVSWDCVNKDGSIQEGATMGLSYGNLTAISTGAIQELNKIIQQQNERIQNLENIINKLTASSSFANFKKII